MGSVTNDLRTATTWSVVLSGLMIVAGLLALGAPLVASVAVTVILGWLLMFSGVLHLAFAWHTNKTGPALWETLLGTVYGAIGIYLLVNPLAGLTSLTLAIAFYLLLEGVLELVLSFQLRPAPGNGWLAFDGLITLVLGVMITTTWPSNAPWVVGTLVGISMFFSGITRLMFSIALRRLVA